MSYAKHINHERDRRGGVFEDHPGTDIVREDSDRLQLVPYIHTNPVKAGRVEAVFEYEYSTDVRYRNGERDGLDFECREWPPIFKAMIGRVFTRIVLETT